jgi:thymidylate kinase
MQTCVRQRFSQLQAQDEREGKVPWYLVNAAQTIEEVQAEINEIVERTVAQVKDEDKPLQVLWKNEE